jgi:hypothetical protein
MHIVHMAHETEALSGTSPSLTLDEWMRDTGMVGPRGEPDDGAFAELIGKDRTSVYRARTGKVKPSFDFIEKVAVATGGRVQPNSFFRKALGQARAAAATPPGGGAPRPFSSASLTTPGASQSELAAPPTPGAAEWPLQPCQEAQA